MSYAKSLVEKNKTALFSANPGDDVKARIKECSRDIKHLNSLLKHATTVSEKQHLTACIGQLMGYRQLMKGFQAIHGGKGLSAGGGNSSNNTDEQTVIWEESQSAFRKRIRTGFITNLKHKDPTQFLVACMPVFLSVIEDVLKKLQAVKVNTVFCGEFTLTAGDKTLEEYKYFTTKNAPIFEDTDVTQWFMDRVKEPILVDLEEFQERDSGWALSAIINLQININKYSPQVGGTYIPLPPQIARKKACVNVQADDDACFAWAVVAALYPAEKHPHRPSKYPHPKTVLNLDGLEFPITLKQIPRFEVQNGVSINVYALKKQKKFEVLPVYLTKAEQEKHVNLLMVQDHYEEESEGEEDKDEEGNPPKYHFVWIKNLSRLVSRQLNWHNGQKYICNRCLHYFQTSLGLEKHLEDCRNLNTGKVRLPTPDKAILKFKDHRNKLRAPFIVYADLECVLEPAEAGGGKYQHHVPCSVGFYVKCSYDDSLSFYKSYRGERPEKWFVEQLAQFAEDVETVFLCPLPMEPLTPDEQVAYDNAVVCHICEKPFSHDDKKVRDHDHLAGRFRFASHESCNINYQDSHTVPVVFHNLSGYDSHFIIKSLACDLQGRLDVLPVNKERYISFTKKIEGNLIKFRFIDSLRFMNAGLDKLASYLTDYPILEKEFSHLNEQCLALLKRKGVYPYDFFTSNDKFKEEQLPPKTEFYNKLNDASISDNDYQHAQTVWREFNIKNLGEYSDLYLKTDVILLADVFEQFRDFGLKTYKLDPAHYYTLPGYTWSCMLKYTGIELELLTDIDMIMFIERGIRGGLSQCMKRYSRANNKYCEDYNPAQPTKYLIYEDINNQYGWAMSEALPYGGFRWVPEKEIKNFNVMEIEDDASVGYILEVDLGYPVELHDLHSDLPFCPEHRCAPDAKEKKLMGTLYDKVKYVIHYRNLKQAVSHGLKLIRVHRILKFNQAPWLSCYIALNTELRKQAKNEFEKNLFKLQNNGCFGKSMENIRKHSNVRLITQWEGRYGAKALIASPFFKSSTIFDENLVAIELNRAELYFNKPIYVGMAILDISKTKLYEFHYDYMKKNFGNNCTAVYTDTDSLIYEVYCDDLYDIIRRDCHQYFDTSDYPLNNQFKIPQVNKKVLGLMKDEMCGQILTDFVGLRSKMYAVKVEGKDKCKKIKGVKKNVIKTHITFEDYLVCLQKYCEMNINQNLIKSEKHEVFSISQNKVALSPRDDKRYLIANDVTTLPWGHYSIMNVD